MHVTSTRSATPPSKSGITKEMVDGQQCDVAVGIVRGSVLSELVVDCPGDGEVERAAKAHLRREFLVAVNKHVQLLDLLRVREVNTSCTLDSAENGSLQGLTARLHELLGGALRSARPLFVDGAVAGTALTDYRFLRGGRDQLGEWRVFPLGVFVREALVCVTAPEATACLTLIEDVDAQLSADELRLSQLAADCEVNAFLSFVDFYHDRAHLPLPPVRVQRASSKCYVTSGTFAAQQLSSIIASLGVRGEAPAQRMLLYGPPEVDKTSIAEALVAELGLPSAVLPDGFVIDSGKLHGTYVGESELKMCCLLRRSQSCPWRHFAVIVDAVEAITSGNPATDLTPILVSHVAEEPGNLLVVMIADFLDRINPAVLRRVPDQLFVDR